MHYSFDGSTLRLYPSTDGLRLTDTEDPGMDLFLCEWVDLPSLRAAITAAEHDSLMVEDTHPGAADQSTIRSWLTDLGAQAKEMLR